MTEKTELNEVEELAQYRVGSKREIIRILTSLSKSPSLITAYIDDNEYLLTSVVTVLPERDLLVLDYGPNELQNERLLEQGNAICVARHQSVNIKFMIEGIQGAKLRDNPVFAAPIPEIMYRLQRREFFRVNMPPANPLACSIFSGGMKRKFRVTNISVGGVGVEDSNLEYEWQRGQVFESCYMELPGFGSLVVDLEVRNIFLHTQFDGSKVMRIGLAFRKLSADRSALVQRFINKLQIEQRRSNIEEA